MKQILARGCGIYLAALILSSVAAAQSSSKTARDETVKTLFGVREFLQTEISPDGKRVAWVEALTGPNGEPSADSAIYVAEISEPESAKRITAGDGKSAHEEHDVAWSPDSRRLTFLSDAASAGQLQLFVADANSGAANKSTSLKGFLATPGWSPDGKWIALLFTENAARAAGPLVAETPDEGVISEEFFEQRLTLVDPATSRVRQISPADTYVYEFSWSPDSRELAITSAKGNGDDNWYIAGLSTIDAATGEVHALVPKPGMQIAVPRWSPDGKNIAFIGGLMSDEPIPGGEIFIVPAKGGAVQNVTPGVNWTANSLFWAPDSQSLLIPGIAGGQALLARAEIAGKSSQLWTGPETLWGVAFSQDTKTTAVIRQSYSDPPEIWAGPVGNWKRLTHRNASLKPQWGEAKSLHWKTDIGEVQGWLIYPREFDPSKKYPLVVDVHGGPAWAYTPAWPTQWAYTFALPADGYFLLMPNPRGSYGRGEKFVQANVKDYGYGDFRDILAGVDEAIRTTPIDSHRLGITGWSYGGYMTMWAVTQTNRFSAAVAGAGIANWQSYTGENKIDQWMMSYFGATVYDDPAVYAKSSPINFIKNVKTPTLIVVGDRDGECPAPQSYEFWHALKTLGVPTQFVIYPNEGHMLINPEHTRDVMERSIAWFNRYLTAN